MNNQPVTRLITKNDDVVHAEQLLIRLLTDAAKDPNIKRHLSQCTIDMMINYSPCKTCCKTIYKFIKDCKPKTMSISYARRYYWKENGKIFCSLSKHLDVQIQEIKNPGIMLSKIQQSNQVN